MDRDVNYAWRNAYGGLAEGTTRTDCRLQDELEGNLPFARQSNRVSFAHLKRCDVRRALISTHLKCSRKPEDWHLLEHAGRFTLSTTEGALLQQLHACTCTRSKGSDLARLIILIALDASHHLAKSRLAEDLFCSAFVLRHSPGNRHTCMWDQNMITAHECPPAMACQPFQGRRERSGGEVLFSHAHSRFSGDD
eukprot:3600177-Rhodomonas_salina.2